MRFLIISQYYEPEIGAAQVRLAAMARRLSEQGHCVDVVTAVPSYPIGRIFDGYRGRLAAVESGLSGRIVRTFAIPGTGRGFRRLLGYLSFTFSSIAAVLAARKPDVVFVESPPPTLAIPGWLASRAHKATLVLNVADLWPDSATSLGLAKPGLLVTAAQILERWAYRRAHAVTAVTEGIRDTLTTRKGVPASRVLFLPNGVDTDLFKPMPYDEQLARRLGIAGRKVVMLAGSLGYGAGLDVILNAAELLRDKPITFLIVGGGSEYERLAAAIESRRLHNVRMLGPRPLHEIAELYSVTDIGLMTLVDSPLFSGTRPARVYPAMASAKPIVYSGFGEGADLIEQAGAGIVVPPGNAAALANAVVELIEDNVRAAELGRHGRAYVEANLSWDRLIQDWLHALKGVLPA